MEEPIKHFAINTGASSDTPQAELRVVYVFAGHRRRADVREHLESLAKQHGFRLDMREFDLVRGSDQDVLDATFWTRLTSFIKEFKPFCIIATPPCSTYSRARHLYKRFPGPRPIRSREYPQGFPWLQNKQRMQALQGTEMATKTWELCDLASDIGAHFLSEFPEDLGATDTGVPASLWQMKQFQDNLTKQGMRTFALFQCEFGAMTPKPTRFISDLRYFEGTFYLGAPQFDNNWKYMGPLPRGCPHPGQHDALIGVNAEGQWKTAPAAHYPGPLCLFLASAIYKTWNDTSSAPVGIFSTEVSTEQDMDTEDDTTPVEQQIKIDSGCQGPPLVTKYAGKSEFFCDGMGLCSPGRWHPHVRQLERTPQQRDYCKRLAALIDKFCEDKLGDLGTAAIRLALGRYQESPFTEEDLRALRQQWFEMLPDKERAREVPEDQPFYLHALAQSLRLMGDPDTEIIDGGAFSSFVEGVHIGHLHPLGPTPQVYRPRVKEPAYDETDWDLSMDNYFRGSEAEAEKILKEHFREEEREGRMAPVSEKEAQREFPGRSLRIAAQGILDKPDGGHRIIHDGTHGVRLNNEIQVLDRLENPGPRELATIMRASSDAGERVVFTVNADIAKAHRRVKVRRADWGVQACRTSSKSKVIWYNKTGTFGVASAAYWWSRLMGLLGRHALNLLGDAWIFVLIFVDDLHLASGGNQRWKQIWRFLAALELVGTPFSYKKFRGGFTCDYVGYWLDYGRFEIGISERRTAWLVQFVDQLEADKWLVMGRRFQEFHGRLGFTSQVLPWVRPLLAPGYSWLAAINKGSTVKVPQLVAMVCMFMRQKFRDGLRKVPCVTAETSRGELFRTDAKCEKGRIVLGGWTLGANGDPSTADWFSLEVLPNQAPWLFKGDDSESAWASTSAELLASLVALKIFKLKDNEHVGSVSHILKCGGGTDNKSTGPLVNRRLSTKFPLMVILMDYLGFCEEKGIRCHLDWRPRDTNVEADKLTNEDFSPFNSSRRIQVRWEDLRFPMIDLLMSFAESFSKRKLEAIEVGAIESQPKFSKSTWG